jgi:hypothetical protein
LLDLQDLKDVKIRQLGNQKIRKFGRFNYYLADWWLLIADWKKIGFLLSQE